MNDVGITIGDYEIDVVVDYFHHEPPYKGSARLCETPDEYYGYTEIEYSIVRIDGLNGTEEGDDLDLPSDVDSDMVYELVMEQINEDIRSKD